MVSLKAGKIGSVEPSNSVTSVGEKVPVRVASIGLGLNPPVGMVLPLKEIPSELRLKYVEPKTSVLEFEKSTVRLRLSKSTVVVTGQVASPDELGPVWFMMSNSPVVPLVTSHET
jgi:hypothetical protein